MRLRDVEDVSKLTPAMQQYANLKKNNESSLLFFRMGDFYELFFEDAKVAANALDIALTKRGKHSGEVSQCVGSLIILQKTIFIL